jgi:hypothetical protein
MKILLLLLFIPLISFSQNKNDNVIIAQKVFLKQVVDTLLDHGYLIDRIDSNYNTLKTDYKKLCSDCVPEIMFNVRIKDSTAYISGKWRSNGGLFGNVLSGNNDYIYFDIMNEKSKVPKHCFLEMDKIAKLLSSNVTYSKQ